MNKKFVKAVVLVMLLVMILSCVATVAVYLLA